MENILAQTRIYLMVIVFFFFMLYGLDFRCISSDVGGEKLNNCVHRWCIKSLVYQVYCKCIKNGFVS